MNNLSKFLKSLIPTESMWVSVVTMVMSFIPLLLFSYGLITGQVRWEVFAVLYGVLGFLLQFTLLPIIYWSGLQGHSVNVNRKIQGKTTVLLKRDTENIIFGIIMTVVLIFLAWPIISIWYIIDIIVNKRRFVTFSKSCVFIYQKEEDGVHTLWGISDDNKVYTARELHLAGSTIYHEIPLPISGNNTAAQLKELIIEAQKNCEHYVVMPPTLFI